MATAAKPGQGAGAGTIRYAVYAGVLVVVSLLDMLINNLPTIFDIALVSAATIGGVVFGRKTARWF